MEKQLDSIHNQLDYFKTRLDNQTLSLYELQINHLTSKLENAKSQLESLEPRRSKRGLVDGLGSLIKSVTGNLDHSDAERYNNAIKILNNNEHKILSEFNDHISLNKNWMAQQTKLIASIAENQEKINSTLELILDHNAYSNNSLLKYAKFAQLLAIISENTDDFALEIIRLENILAFVRASSTHHSMLGINHLKDMINRLRTIYRKTEIIDDDLREYYSIIKPGSYFSGKRIVIVFKFPIVSPGNFNLYKLSIVPNKLNQTLIPPYPIMATDGKVFMYMEAECPKFNRYHLCEENVNHQPRDLPDCIQNLVINHSLDETCRPTKITLTKEAMEQLDDQYYTLIFPQPTRVELHCERQEYTTLSGSYLATIPQKCFLRTEQFTIININDRIKGQPLKINEIPNTYNLDDNDSIPHLKLNSINLEGLHHIEEKILMQHPVEIKSIDGTVYHTTLPFYTILLCGIVLMIAITIRRYLRRKTITIENPSHKEEGKTEEHPYAVPEVPRTRRNIPATFSLKVLK